MFFGQKGYNYWQKDKSPLNFNDKNDDIEHSMEEYVTLNP
jgi:hypothetical protein